MAEPAPVDRQRLLAMARTHGFTWLFTAALVAQCLPLLMTRVLPFHDAPGIIGLGGVFAHWADPRSRVQEFFDVDFGAYPSIAYFGWAFVAAKLHVPVDVAFNAFIALFCLAGPPLALLVVLRAFDKPRALAFLALPVGYHQQIWFGFLGSAAAITGLLLALGCARLVAIRPSRASHLGLAASLLFVALCHPFSLALTLVVVAPLLVPDRAPALATRFGLRLACFLPTLIFLAAWARSFFAGGSADGISFTSHLSRQLHLQRPPLGEDLRNFATWLGGGYQSGGDGLVTGVGLAVLLAFLVVGVRGQPDAEPSTRHGRWWLAWSAAMLALGYLLLPNKVYWPVYWWGLRVRCVVPLFLVGIVAIRRTRRGLPLWSVAPALAAALLFAGYVTADFRTHWRGRALDGFDRALAAIPPGHSVLAFPVMAERHYTQPHPYLVQYYVARTGGRATPYLLGHPGSYWVTMKPAPAAPPWGDRTQFDWRTHGLGYDYFLVELPPDCGSCDAQDPLLGVPRGAVTPLSMQGRWRLYRRERAPLPTDGPPRADE